MAILFHNHLRLKAICPLGNLFLMYGPPKAMFPIDTSSSNIQVNRENPVEVSA